MSLNMADPVPNKRLKVGNDTDDSACVEQNEAVTPCLPAQTIGGVLDFMVYSDVRPMLMAGKPMAVDSSRCVKTLSVMKTSELKVRPALRFSNVEELNICCLFDYEGQRLSAEAAERIVPFLEAFPKLETLFIGGGYEEDEFGLELAEYFDFSCEDQPDHTDIFHGLVDKLAAAITANKLPYLTKIRGLNGVGGCIDDVEDSSEPCDRCVHLCKTLPLINVVSFIIDDDICLSDVERDKIISERPGGRDFLKRISNILPGKIKRYTTCILLKRPAGKTSSQKQLLENLDEQVPRQKAENPRGAGRIRHLQKDRYEAIDALIAFGYSPGLVSRQCLYKSFLDDYIKTDAWTKCTLEFLLSRGFDIDVEDFCVFDETGDDRFQQVLDENDKSVVKSRFI